MRGSEVGPAADVPGGPGGTPGGVRLASLAEAPAAAALHASLITEGFLSSLGPRFLGRLYRRIADDPGSFLLVAEGDGAPAGFLAGSVAVSLLYRRFLLRDGVAASLAAPLRLLGALPRVLETLRHGRSAAGDGPEQGELLAVAVDPRWRGHGVGRRLVEAFLAELERRGVGAARVVVGADNEPALSMYRRAGFTPTRAFEFHRGVRSVLMETPVPRVDPGP